MGGKVTGWTETDSGPSDTWRGIAKSTKCKLKVKKVAERISKTHHRIPGQ